ncbi:MAG: hypothetical protein HY275_08645 [Gemmatimonadetes bacterium]|nr:hypothetical protein [Gemmatimonadota bacterium]
MRAQLTRFVPLAGALLWGAACVDVPEDFVRPKVGSVSIIAGQSQVTTIGSDAVPPAIRLLGRDSQPLFGVEVRYSVKNAGASVFPTNVRTDSMGVAAPRVWTVSGTPGTDTLVAVVVGVGTYTFLATVTPPCAATGAIAVNDSINGAVTAAGCLTNGGRRAVGYTTQNVPTSLTYGVTLSMRGSTYKGRLELQRFGVPVATSSFDTSTAIPNRASVIAFLPGTGATVLAMAELASATGPFSLVSVGNPVVSGCEPNVFIAPGALTTQASIDANACTITDQNGAVYYAHRYTIRLATGQRMVARMSSTAIDPYLLVIDGNGNVVAGQDVGTISSVAVDYTAPAAGYYTIAGLSTRSPRATGGPYIISVDP